MSDTKQERDRSRSPVRNRSRSRSPRRNRNDRQRPFSGGRRIVCRNVPYEIRWQELKDMFRKDIGDVTYVEMLETPDGKSKGVALVEFKDPDHAKKAIEEYHQKKLHDRAIIVREERDKDRQEFLQHQNMRDRGGRGGMGPVGMGGLGGMGPGGMGGAGGMSLPPGVTPQMLTQLGIEPPITNTVFVANLDYKVTWWKLKDVFKLAGNVIKAEIKEDKNGKSRGMGVVVFDTPLEAVQAVSMFNGQVLYDRNMIVRIDKGPEPEKPKLPSGLKSIGMGLGAGGAPISTIGGMGNNGSMGMSDSYLKQDLGMGGGGGAGSLMGMGGLGGGAGGLGLLNSGLGGGSDMGLGGFGGLGGMGMAGLGGSGSLSSGGLGVSGSMSDMGLGLAGKMGDGYGMGGGLGNTSNGNLSGLGGLGPSLSSLSAMTGDRMGMDTGRGGMDRLGGMDRMGGMGVGMDRMSGAMDRMSGMDSRIGGMRDSYGSGRGGDMRDGRDEGRRTTRPDNCTVQVKNLPYSVTWQNLKEYFREVGDVKFAEIVMDKGRSTGVGYVRFGNEMDAQRAIDTKHRSRMERRNIDVSLFRN